MTRSYLDLDYWIMDNLIVIWTILHQPGGARGSDVLVMELCEMGSVSTLLASSSFRYGLVEKDVIRFLRQTGEAVNYLWENNIYHRDIKPANVLAAVDEFGEKTFKLTDFGGSHELTEDDDHFHSCFGTYEYMLPEMHRIGVAMKAEGGRSVRPNFSYEADMWSLACTIFHACCGRAPFKVVRGRADSKKLLSITTKKPDGAIGAKEEEDGMVNYLYTFPGTCELSKNIQFDLVELLKGMMNRAQPLKPKQFIKIVREITDQIPVDVFQVKTAQMHKVYINPADTLDKFSLSCEKLLGVHTDNQVLKQKMGDDLPYMVSDWEVDQYHPIWLLEINDHPNPTQSSSIISKREFPEVKPELWEDLHEVMDTQTSYRWGRDTLAGVRHAARGITEQIFRHRLLNDIIETFRDWSVAKWKTSDAKVNPTINYGELVIKYTEELLQNPRTKRYSESCSKTIEGYKKGRQKLETLDAYCKDVLKKLKSKKKLQASHRRYIENKHCSSRMERIIQEIENAVDKLRDDKNSKISHNQRQLHRLNITLIENYTKQAKRLYTDVYERIDKSAHELNSMVRKAMQIKKYSKKIDDSVTYILGEMHKHDSYISKIFMKLCDSNAGDGISNSILSLISDKAAAMSRAESFSSLYSTNTLSKSSVLHTNILAEDPSPPSQCSDRPDYCHTQDTGIGSEFGQTNTMPQDRYQSDDALTSTDTTNKTMHQQENRDLLQCDGLAVSQDMSDEYLNSCSPVINAHTRKQHDTSSIIGDLTNQHTSTINSKKHAPLDDTIGRLSLEVSFPDSDGSPVEAGLIVHMKKKLILSFVRTIFENRSREITEEKNIKECVSKIKLFKGCKDGIKEFLSCVPDWSDVDTLSLDNDWQYDFISINLLSMKFLNTLRLHAPTNSKSESRIVHVIQLARKYSIPLKTLAFSNVDQDNFQYFNNVMTTNIIHNTYLETLEFTDCFFHCLQFIENKFGKINDSQSSSDGDNLGSNTFQSTPCAKWKLHFERCCFKADYRKVLHCAGNAQTDGVLTFINCFPIKLGSDVTTIPSTMKGCTYWITTHSEWDKLRPASNAIQTVTLLGEPMSEICYEPIMTMIDIPKMFPYIKSLTIENVDLSRVAMQQSLISLGDLMELKIINCSLCDEHVESITTILELQQNLQRLEIYPGPFTGKLVEEFLSKIMGSRNTLLELRLHLTGSNEDMDKLSRVKRINVINYNPSRDSHRKLVYEFGETSGYGIVDDRQTERLVMHHKSKEISKTTATRGIKGFRSLLHHSTSS